ncbi:MAG: fibronectin type III domain-containing protein [Bdellovibrionota bacterium]
MSTLRNLTIILSLSLSAFFISGCLTESGTESGSTVVIAPDPTPPASAQTDPERTVCDPFKTNSPQARDRGLVANLFYLSDDQPRYNNIADFMENAHVAEANIYLDRLFIPTRPFDRGFYTQSGTLVTNANGNTLYEYFGMHLESQLQLAPNEPAGYYQLAVLADDGALLKIPDGNGGFKTIVDNDGTHATKMACATEPVYLDHNTKIPMIMQYYQGPRYHVSLVSMWRPWPDGVSNTNAVNDPYCGRSGNSLFFDSTKNPVEAKASFYELLSRDWKVLENANYNFPNQAVNPCVPTEEPLTITNFTISNILRDRATLNWTTNIPSTSQGWYKNISTSVSGTTSVDSTLVQTHSLTITGLAPNTLFSVKAISTSPGGQNAISDERAFKTPR